MNASPLVAAALLAVSAAPVTDRCDDYQGKLCVDAGTERSGRVIARDAVLDFRIERDNLRLTVRDLRSGTRTVLDLPRPQTLPVSVAPPTPADLPAGGAAADVGGEPSDYSPGSL